MLKKVNFLAISHVICDLFERVSPIISTFILIGFSALSFSQSPNCFAADWLHFGYDDSYASRNPVENTIGINNVSQLQKQWGLSCDDGFFRTIFRSPALYNGTLYTTSAGSILQAYNARTGQQLWTFGSNRGTAWTPQPVVSEDGVVFYLQVAGIYGDLYSVNASTGTMIWKSPISFELGFNETSLLTIDEANNRVYLVAPAFGPDEGALYAIDKETGKIAWYKNKTVGNLSAKGDYVMLKAGKIFGLTDVDWFDDQMYRLDVMTQSVDFLFDVPAPLPDADDDKILQYGLCGNKLIVGVGVNDDHITDIDKGSIVMYDVNSPSVVRRIDFQYPITGQTACNTTTNTIYVPTNPYLYALNATTGQEVWRYMGYGSIYAPSIANGIVYFISDTNMYAVNEATGQKLFSYALGYSGEESSQVAIDDGMLYFSGNGGTCDLFALGGDAPATAGPLVASVLPTSRSIQVGNVATVFATIINTGRETAESCGILLDSGVPASRSFWTTDPQTNAVTGEENQGADIAPGEAQSYVLALTAEAAFQSTEIAFEMSCENADAAGLIPGVNTLLMSASSEPIADIVALAATRNNDGIVNIPGTSSTGIFSVASVNIGAGTTVRVSADTGGATLPMSVSLCETDPASGVCLGDIAGTVTTDIAAGATPTFGIFVTGAGEVPFDPASNRVFVRFVKANGGAVRGATSVAVRTQ